MTRAREIADLGGLITADSSGAYFTDKVGIGTASPDSTATLHIKSSSEGTSGDAVVIIEADQDNNNEGDNPRLEFWQDGRLVKMRMGYNDNNFEMFNEYAGQLNFGTSNIVRMSISSTGNVGIGTTAPSSLLHLNSSAGHSITSTYTGQETYKFEHGTSGFYVKKDNVFLAGLTQNHDLTLYNTSGVEYAIFDGSSGNVGIGTSSPSKLLTVHYDAPAYDTVDDVLRLVSKFTSTNNAASAYAGSGPAIVFAGGIGDNQTRDRARIVAAYEGSNVSGLAFHTQNTADIITEKMRIQNNGNVGIGTTNPIMPLQVAGNIYCNGGDSFLDTGRKLMWGNSTTWVEGNNNTSLEFGVNSSERMRIDANGNVGIGVTPSAWRSGAKAFQSGGNGYVTLWEQANGSTNLGFGVYESASNVFNYTTTGDTPTLYSQVTGVHKWYNAPSSGTAGDPITFTQAMTLDASGNLLVGTTNTANIATHTPNIVTDLQYGINDGSNIASFGLDRISFNSSNYYVLNASATGVKLVNGATSWTTQSDENSKENIVELSNALTAVNAMRCVRYNLKSQTSDDVKIGFIAQDWQSSYPEVVATDTDGTLGMNYTETIPVLLKAIQEQQALIEAQATAITALTAGITTLEGRITTLEGTYRT